MFALSLINLVMHVKEFVPIGFVSCLLYGFTLAKLLFTSVQSLALQV